MSLWQRPLKRLQAIAEYRTYRFRLNSLKGFLSLFLVGTILSVALAACSGGTGSNSSTEPSNANASPVAATKDNVELTLVSFAVT
ncbi:MAG: sulfate ABC transporter substrate-binding protein, partial [Nostoc sp.]